jgi:hypothetical protein
LLQLESRSDAQDSCPTSYNPTSPPSYPSPWQDGSGDWATAVSKARAFVGKLSILEMVNLTTGVGFVRRCGQARLR